MPEVDLEIERGLKIISTREELWRYFNENLQGLENNDLVRRYVADLTTDFAYDRGNKLVSVIYDETPERVKINEFLGKRDFSSLKEIGDAFLWFCGFLPEHVIDKGRNKPRFILTLEDYVYYGRAAYFSASLICNTEESPVKEISRDFVWIAQSIFNMKNRINPEMRYSINQETLREIEKVINEGKPIFGEESDMQN